MNPLRLSALLLGALAIPNTGHAQRVIADISIHEGPVTGRVIVGHPPVYRERTVAVVAPRHWRAVKVYRVQRTHRTHNWYRAHGYRSVRIWYDARRGYYYDQYHPGLAEVSVYYDGGRYYRDDWRDGDRRDGRDGHYGHDDYHDHYHH